MTYARDEFLDTEYRPPAPGLPTVVAAIFADVLEVDRYGADDSFYDFGGTSLQAIRICARIERETGIGAQPVVLFEHDVLADFADQLHVLEPS